MTLRSICLIWFHPAKKLETVNTASANVTSLLINFPAPDDPDNSNKSLFSCTSQSVYKD